MAKTKYFSEKKNKDYNFVPGNALALDFDALKAMFNDEEGTNPCYLVMLDARQIDYILSHVDRFPRYHWIWGLPSPKHDWDDPTKDKWQEICGFVDEVRCRLMSGCDLNLLLKLKEKEIAALTGQQVDFDLIDELGWDKYLKGQVDYRQKGLANRLGPEVSHDSIDTIQATIKSLTGGIDLGGVVSGLDERLGEIVSVLGLLSQIGELVTSIAGVAQLAGIKNELANIKSSIDAKNCCCSGGGGNPIEPSPVAPPEEGVPPDGFDTWNEYKAYKCRAANKITDDLIATCYNFATLPGFIAGLAGAALYAFLETSMLSGALVGLMALGFSAPVAAATIITALIFLIVTGTGQLGYFYLLGGELDSNKNDIVCGLYNAASVEAARIFLLGKVDNAIGTLTGIDEFISDQLNDVITTLLGTAVFNTLFEKNADAEVYVGTVDCGACGGGVFEIVSFGGGPCGTVISGDFSLDTVTEIRSDLRSTYGTIRQQIRFAGVGGATLTFNVTLVSTGEPEIFQDGIDPDGNHFDVNWTSPSSIFPAQRSCKQWDFVGAIDHNQTSTILRVTPSTYTP